MIDFLSATKEAFEQSLILTFNMSLIKYLMVKILYQIQMFRLVWQYYFRAQLGGATPKFSVFIKLYSVSKSNRKDVLFYLAP